MDDLRRLAQLIEQITGNVIPEGQYPHLEQVARDHARKAGFPELGAYVDFLEGPGSEAAWRQLLPDVTIKESFLFRVPEQFRALREEILPRLARVRPEGHRLRVWSAGCARGEEPATLAIVLAECPFLANRDWEIVATDIDETALGEARRSEFGTRAMAQVPPLLLGTWFEKRGDVHVLSPDLLRRIRFQAFNFFASPYLSLGGAFDVIFLRNVLIYFTPERQRQVLEPVLRLLAEDGYLFLGHSESLWRLSDEVEPLECDKCFVYVRRQGNESRPVRRRHRLTGAGSSPSIPALREAAVKRPVRAPTIPALALADPLGPPFIGASSPPPPRPASQEGEALAEAARALAEDRLDEAQEIVDRCLADDKTSVRAHALSGLLHDLQGRAEAASAAYRAALFLEPGLYQIRFLLAHRLEHLGWQARARNEYRQVLTDLSNGGGRELGSPLGGPGGLLGRLLPKREEAAARCRRALERIGSANQESRYNA